MTPETVEPDPTLDVATCLNCSAELGGSYCADCGQSASTSRYTAKTIGKEFYDQFRKIDILTTFRTFWMLTVRPGTFVRGYLEGRRVGFLNPVKYFFYAFVIQALVGSWAYWVTNDYSLKEMGKQNYTIEVVSLFGGLFWGLLWALFYRKSDLNTVENIVAAFYYVAQVILFGMILNVALVPFHQYLVDLDAYVILLEVGVWLGYSFFFARQLFAEKYYLLVPKQIVLSILFVTLVFVIEMTLILLMIATGLAK